jgi:ureidoglycolate dehydrogenase (NAD+)
MRAEKVVTTEWLERVMDATLAAHDVDEAQRREVVHGVLFGSLRGIDTHGVSLFGTYVRELRNGRAKAKPTFEFHQARPALARLGAGGALGVVAGFEAARRAAAMARESGVGVVVVVDSNHFGAASIYTTELARQGLIGIALSNSDAIVLPVNGRVPRQGTNPISMAAEGESGEMFCADLATSQGSFLRSLALRAEGAAIPPGVLADEEGRDVVTSGGAPAHLLPLGGYKGQCLGMMVSILCAVLGGAPFDWELQNLFDEPWHEPRQISHLVAALDVASLTDPAEFRRSLSRYLSAYREPMATGSTSSFPGYLEAQTARHRGVDGVPIRSDDYRLLLSFEAEFVGRARMRP